VRRPAAAAPSRPVGRRALAEPGGGRLADPLARRALLLAALRAGAAGRSVGPCVCARALARPARSLPPSKRCGRARHASPAVSRARLPARALAARAG